jgi:hypothetical protein
MAVKGAQPAFSDAPASANGTMAGICARQSAVKGGEPAPVALDTPAQTRHPTATRVLIFPGQRQDAVMPAHEGSSLVETPAEGATVAAAAVVTATAAEVAALRPKVGPVNGPPLPGPFLKHAEEQSVVGLHALYQALHAANLPADQLAPWGVVGAPRFLGRAYTATALRKFGSEGAWGVSPHIIPHASLHAVAGAISLALKVHGPNFGAGGGPGHVAEGLLAALALLGTGLPGVLAVCTAWEPEPVPFAAVPAPAPVCRAVALVLTPAGAGPRLQFTPTATATTGPREPIPLASLAAAAEGRGGRGPTTWDLGAGRLTWVPGRSSHRAGVRSQESGGGREAAAPVACR